VRLPVLRPGCPRRRSPERSSMAHSTRSNRGSAATGAPASARRAAQAPGILPCQALERLIAAGEGILAAAPIDPAQIQPASLDLRLGAVAYRVRASFLPGKGATVARRLEDLAMHRMDIGAGA